MSEDAPPIPHARLPGTVLWAAGLTAFHALLVAVGVVLTLSAGQLGWASVNIVLMALLVAGALGLVRLRPWARYLVLTLSIVSWVMGLAAGRIDVISTNIALIVLLLLPSTRTALETGSPGREGTRPDRAR